MGARMSLLIIGGNDWSGTSNLIISVTSARQEVNPRDNIKQLIKVLFSAR